MMILLIKTLLCLGTLIYASLLFFIVFMWKKGRQNAKHPAPDFYPFISVLIPARNEEKDLPSCIQSILQQDYPADRMEIIVIDDHSTDGTAAIVKNKNDHRLSLLQLEHFLPKNKDFIAYKKAALELGVQCAKGTYIITTDADCIVPHSWLKTYATAFNNGKEMVLGAVKIEKKQGLLTAFQDMDVAGTMLLTAAAVFAKHPILSNGANFGFSKSLFKELGGYEGNEDQASGDDIFLLQKACSKHIDTITFLNYPTAIVQTTGVKTWKALFWQRLRWAGKTSAYRDPFLIIFQALVFLFNLLLWGCTILAFTDLLANPFPLLFVWLFKLGIDFFYLRFALFEQGEAASLTWFLPAFFMHGLYIISVGCLALLPIKAKWKGRKT